MSLYDDIIAGIEGPAEVAPLTEPTTIDFPFEGQNFQIDTSTFESDEEAIDAFLTGQNEPVSITPTDIVDTEVQAEPSAAPVTPTDPAIGGKEFNAIDVDEDLSFVDFIKGRAATFAGGTNTKVGGLIESAVDAAQSFGLRSLGVQSEEVEAFREGRTKIELVDDLKRRGRELTQLGQNLTPENPVGEFVTQGVDATLNMIPSIMVSLATKKPNLGLAELGVEVFGQSYANAKDRGLEPQDAAYEAARQVLWEVGPEKAFGFFSKLPGSKGLKEWFGLLLREGLSEITTSGLQQTDEFQLQGKPWEGWEPVLKRVAKEGALGAFVGGTIASPTLLRTPKGTLDDGGDVTDRLGAPVDKVGDVTREGINTVPDVVERIKQNIIDQDARMGQSTAERQVRIGVNKAQQEGRVTAGEINFGDDEFEGLSVDTITDPGVLPEPENDPEASRVGAIRQQVLEELGLARDGADLTESDVDRIVNLRADTPAQQIPLDLGQEQAPVQETLDLQRDFDAPGQFPDSGTQQDLGLRGSSDVALDPTNVAGLERQRAVTLENVTIELVSNNSRKELEVQLEDLNLPTTGKNKAELAHRIATATTPQTTEVLQFPQQPGPIERSLTTGTKAEQRIALDDINALEDRQRTDAAELAGFDFTEQQEANRQALAASQARQVPAEVDSPGLTAQQLRANDVEAAELLEEGQTLAPDPRLSPAEVLQPDQGQLALRETTVEPVQQGIEQELPLEGGGEGSPPAGRIPPSGPSGRRPTPPPPSIRGGRSTQALAQVAASRSIVGESDIIEVSNNGDTIGIDGRSFKNKSRDGAAPLDRLPPWSRVYIDMARNLSVASLRTTKELVRAVGTQGRALGTRTQNSIARLESLYRAEHGVPISEAPAEQLKIINNYMHGLVGRSVVESETVLSGAFLDKIDEVRTDIKELSDVMLRENMIPDEMRISFEENAGSYLHVIYAANVLKADRGASEILDSIPDEVRNQWMAEFSKVNLDHTIGKDGSLADMTHPQLMRIAKNLRITTRGLVPDRKNGGTKEAETINGVEVATMNKDDLQQIVANHSMNEEEMSNIMLVILRSVSSGSLTGGKGRDRGIERRRNLGRSAEQLREAGYSEREIKLNKATRELLMETTDPITNIGITMTKMMNTVMAHRLINNMATLEQAGLASVGEPGPTGSGLTELLIPEGHALGDIRIPGKNGDIVLASTQGTSTKDGLFVHPETARLFQHMVDIKPGSAPGNLFRWTAGIAKVNLTAGNPRSHTRNTLSASMIGFIRGHWFTSGKTAAQAFDAGSRIITRDLARRNRRGGEDIRQSQDSLDVILEYMTSLGIMNDSVRTGPVKELLTKALTEKDSMSAFGESTYMDWDGVPIEDQIGALAKGTRGKIKKGATKLIEYPMAAFRLEDEGMKVVAFMIERRRHAALTGNTEMLQLIDGDITNPTEAQMDSVRGFDKEIAKHITNLYPTYSRVPAFVRAMSRNVFVTPFPSFNAEMWRNGLNDLKDLADLARQKGRYEGVSAGAATALVSRRVTAKATYGVYTAGISGVIGLAGITAIGLDPTDDDQDEAFLASEKAVGNKKVNANAIDMPLRALSHSYIADSWFQIVDFVPGQTVRIRNLAFTLPNSQQAAFGTNIGAGIEALIVDGDWGRAGDAVFQGAVNLASDYLKQDVLASAVLEANDGVTATGFRVWDPLLENAEFGTPEYFEKMWQGAKHIGSVAFPTSRVLKEGETFADAYRDDRFMEEFTEFVMGINDVDYRLDSLYVSKMRQLRDSSSGVSVLTTKINRLISNNEPISDDKLIEQYLSLESRRKDAFHNLQRMTRNGESLGMTRQQMQKALTADGVGNFGGMDLRDMQNDKYTPHKIELRSMFDLFTPPKKTTLSPEERKQATRDFKDTIRHRVDLIKNYKQQVKDGDYTFRRLNLQQDTDINSLPVLR